MKSTTHTYRFETGELEEMKENTSIEDDEEILREWARRNYPMGTGLYAVSNVETKEEGGEISIHER